MLALFLALIPALSQAGAASNTPQLAIQELATLYRESTTLEDLLQATGALGVVSSRAWKPADLKAELPRLSVQGSTLRFGATSSLEVVSLKERSFKVNGKSFEYRPEESFLENMLRLEPPKRRAGLHELFGIPSAWAVYPDVDGDLFHWYELRGRLDSPENPLILSIPESMIKALGTVTVGSVMASMSYLWRKGYAYSAAPSCEQQVKDLAELMKRLPVKMTDLDCKGHIRTTDRSATFRDTRPGKPAINKVYADWDLNVAYFEHNNPGAQTPAKGQKIYLFGKEGLSQVREKRPSTTQSTVALTPRSAPSYLTHSKGSRQLKEEERFAGPYIQVLQYLGKNWSCYKCAEEIRSSFASGQRLPTRPTAPGQQDAR
jgi:hypothetical protein